MPLEDANSRESKRQSDKQHQQHRREHVHGQYTYILETQDNGKQRNDDKLADGDMTTREDDCVAPPRLVRLSRARVISLAVLTSVHSNHVRVSTQKSLTKPHTANEGHC